MREKDLKKGERKGEGERTRTRVQGQEGSGVTSRRSALAARDRLIPLNCVELRGIIFSILGKRQLNGRTGSDGDMQCTPGSHKAAQSRRRDTHGIQGVSDRRSYKEEEEIQVGEFNLMSLNTKGYPFGGFNSRLVNYFQTRFQTRIQCRREVPLIGNTQSTNVLNRKARPSPFDPQPCLSLVERAFSADIHVNRSS